MIQKVKSVKTIVLKILRDDPRTRDNDRLLMILVWCHENHLLGDKQNLYPFRDFAIFFINGQYSDPESIRRSRQKIQEKYPELRGNTYRERIYRDVEMRKEINKLDFSS